MFSKLISFFSAKSYDDDGGEGRFYPLHNSVYGTREMTRTDYLALYQSWVYLCVSTIADSVAELEYKLERNEKEIDHPHLGLITPDFLRATVSQMLLTGTAYWMKEMIGKRVDSIQMMRSDMVMIEENANGSLKSYLYNARMQYRIQPEEMMDFSLFNPMKTFPFAVKGISPMSAIAIQAEMDRVANKWNWNFFKNGTTLGSMLMTDQEMKPENKELIIQKWKAQFQGVNNAHAVAILDKGLKYQAMNISKKELDFVESKRFTRDEILAIFKIPPAVVGITENANKASAQVSLETYFRICISPLATQIAEVITKELFQGVGKFEFVNVVPTDVELLKVDMDSGAITINEYRKARGYAPIQGGDILPNKTEAPVKPVAPEKTTFRKSIESALRKNTKGTYENSKDRLEKGNAKWNAKILRTNPYESKFTQEVRKIFETQKNDVLNSITETKSLKKVNIRMPSTLKWRMLWITLADNYKEVFQNEGTQALEDIGVSSIFQIGNPSVNRFVKDSIALLSKNADEYTREVIEKTLLDGNEQGLGAKQIANLISANFEEFGKVRAERIARTEITTTSTQAEVEAWKQSGVVSGKEWFTAEDERLCPQCFSMDGKVIGLENDFFKKGDTIGPLKLNYRNINGPSLHPNCRCTLLPIVK